MRNFISENKNLIVFLICSVISTAIWMSMSLSKTYSRLFTIKLVFKNIPSDKILNSDTINLSTSVNAKGWDLAFRNSSEKIINIDLAKYPNNSSLVFNDLKSLIQEKLNKLNVLDVSPSSLKLEFEELLSKKVPVKLNLEKKFSPNYFFVKAPSINPDSVIISSDANTLKGVDFIASEKINISEKDFFLEDVKLIHNKKIRIDTSSIEIEFDTKEFVEKEFVLDVNIDNNKNEVEFIIFPEQIILKCLVPITIYENILASDFYISADFNNIEVQKNNRLLLTVKESPENVRNIQLQKEKVEFIIYQ